ncbi:hypothetical protein [Pedobacter frigidisoli]|uniref:hypothetical protein n=1 Tax=Pedobacter frigidisoli TaxID=2530455 RepID=UPI00292E6582|nr:hypothetical protein [Pedobacter frigidisoli]
MNKISGVTLAENVGWNVSHIVFVTSHFEHELMPNLKDKWHYLFKPTSVENFRELFQQLQNESEI